MSKYRRNHYSWIHRRRLVLPAGFSVTLFVFPHIPESGKCSRAEFALVGFFLRVNSPDVSVHVVLLAESFLTVLTNVRFLSGVDQQMLFVRTVRSKPFKADVTFETLITCGDGTC